MMCIVVVLFGFNLFGIMCFLDLYVYFLHQIREVFFHYFFKEVFNFLFFLLSLWHPYDLGVGTFRDVLECSYTCQDGWGRTKWQPNYNPEETADVRPGNHQ